MSARDTFGAKLAVLADIDQQAVPAPMPLPRCGGVYFLEAPPVAGVSGTE
jgi:hypothetical protein